MLRISHIVAMTPDRVIGRDNDLPWRHPEDLKYFKRVTMGKPILMGRKTHESIGRPLPGRTNIILTRRLLYRAEGCIIAHNIDDAVAAAAKAVTEANAASGTESDSETDELMIIGGAEIYRATLPETQRIYLTRVLDAAEGDTFYPELDYTQWSETLIARSKKLEWVVLDRIV